MVDVYEYILNGRLAGNIRLHENDVIVVGPYDCLVGVQGNVKRPMFYEMRPTESVAQVIKYAGGFTGDAYKKAVRLVRKSGERYSVHTVDEFDMSSFKLADGDAITVDGMVNRFENMVEVKGAVFRAGQFELGKQITTVRSLIEAAGGLTEDAFTSRGVMYRMKEDRTLEAQAVDLAGIMAGTVADVPLKNEDVLFIPTQADRVSERIVTIDGEVIQPGSYQCADNEMSPVAASGTKPQNGGGLVGYAPSTTKVSDCSFGGTVNGVTVTQAKLNDLAIGAGGATATNTILWDGN